MDEGPAPPAVGVNANVAETPDLPATRSAVLIKNITDATEPPAIAPDSTESDTTGSALVCTVTNVPPALAAPMVRPASVTVTAMLAASAVPPVVMMMDVAPGTSGDRVAPIVDSVAEGMTKFEKKPEG